MPLVRITNGFEKLRDNDLAARARYIKDQMTDNPNFPTPDPHLSELHLVITAFEAALLAAQTGNRQDIVVKKVKRQELIDMLHLLGNYVLFTSRGDAAVATSSGFHIKKTPEPAPAITAPEGVHIDKGINTGELVLSFKKVPAAHSYVYAFTADPLTPDSQWQTRNGTITKNTFTGLERGKRYWCRVAAVGIKNQVAYSAPVTQVVQ
jgi:hypothetical protein